MHAQSRLAKAETPGRCGGHGKLRVSGLQVRLVTNLKRVFAGTLGRPDGSTELDLRKIKHLKFNRRGFRAEEADCDALPTQCICRTCSKRNGHPHHYGLNVPLNTRFTSVGYADVLVHQQRQAVHDHVDMTADATGAHKEHIVSNASGLIRTRMFGKLRVRIASDGTNNMYQQAFVKRRVEGGHHRYGRSQRGI